MKRVILDVKSHFFLILECSRILLEWGTFQFSSVMSKSLWPQGLWHARLPCPSLPPRICSNSCPLSQWCHPIISSSVTPFSCLQSFPASGSFPMSWFFTSGDQNTATLASASVFPVNLQGWFPFRLTGLVYYFYILSDFLMLLLS